MNQLIYLRKLMFLCGVLLLNFLALLNFVNTQIVRTDSLSSLQAEVENINRDIELTRREIPGSCLNEFKNKNLFIDDTNEDSSGDESSTAETNSSDTTQGSDNQLVTQIEPSDIQSISNFQTEDENSGEPRPGVILFN